MHDLLYHPPQAELALRSLHIEGVSLQQLLTVEHHSPLHFSSSSAESTGQDLFQQYRKNGLTFDEFCSVYAELKFILLKSSSDDAGSLLDAYLSTPLKWIASKHTDLIPTTSVCVCVCASFPN